MEKIEDIITSFAAAFRVSYIKGQIYKVISEERNSVVYELKMHPSEIRVGSVTYSTPTVV